ncbi:E3 ubiquitin-protein ligase UPL3-like [Cornus florida]|uniref:E3 ubiquitin-protein ligase UPL3-like n=1 Tax=Cornus florida TaxID=4283 RepID=UPI00289B488E|nr:E3 ubiquitin-protein ligase UPL3-like [Cornus florida]
METRRRKREEANSSAPSSSSSGPATRSRKRTRLSATSSSVPATATANANANTVVVSSTTTRSRASRTKNSLPSPSSTPMESTNEPSGSVPRRESGGRRGKNNGSNKDNSDKGKEKEHEVRARVRDRDTERSSGLNIDGGADDDDNDSDGDEGILHQNLTSASSALQGLLRKLGVGLDELLPSSAMGRKGGQMKILSGLRADGEEGRQVEALTQLCEMLCIATEESLSTFPVESFVPVLVGLLNHESNPDIMLLAARALTHLCDVLPSSCAAVVHYGAVQCFVARLLTIEYMDLAEQSLQALKKISHEHPTACLRGGALMAVLSYLDFFSTGVQRVALSTAANMCKKLPSDAADFVMEAVPLLINLLQYHDAKVLEEASVCLTRISEAFTSSPDKLDELCHHGLVTQAASLISAGNSGGGQASLSTSTFTGLIRLLSSCSSGSPIGAKTLLVLGISGILKDILSGSGLVANISVSPALSRPPEQIFEIVNLANELLPPLPHGTIYLPAGNNLFVKGSLPKKSPVSSSGKQEDTDGSVPEVSAREKLLNDQPRLLQQFGMDLLPVLIQIYGSSVNGPVRHKCLSVIGKLMYFSTADMIQSLNGVTNISSFLAGVLAWKDPQVLVPALQIAEILMEKLPGTFSKMFVREGVVHAVDALILAGSPSNALSRPSSSGKVNDSIPGTSSRSRRYRRRGGNSSPDVRSTEESKDPVPSVGSPPTSVQIPTVNSSIRMEVTARAKVFKDKYFPSDPGATEVGVTDDLLHLKNLCMKLNAGVDYQKTKTKGKSKVSGPRLSDISASKEENLVEVILEMLAELTKGDGVSTFEFIGSGVIAALLNYFSCGYFSKEKISEANLPKLRQQAIKRYKSFVAVTLPSNLDGGTVAPMSGLVQKLQNALSSLERFPVVLSHTSSSTSGSTRLSSGLSALSQPFKLRLCRAQGEKSLRDFSSNVILIDPLASLAAVEAFIWPRVQRSESGQKPSASVGNSESGTTPTGAAALSPSTSISHRHSTRSRSSLKIGDMAKKDTARERTTSVSKGKGKVVLNPAQEETGGPQTRNATRKKAAMDEDAPMKPVNTDSSSEDEELDISPMEIDDALVIEDDDISDDDDDDDDHDDVLRDDTLPLCVPDKVHDVKLGDPAEDSLVDTGTGDSQANPASGFSSRAATARASDSTEFRSGNSFGSRSAMSFAAAAMAGSNDPPRLIFSAGGKQLNRHLTIYQAIQRQLALDEEDAERYTGNDSVSSDGGRLWSDVYTVTYQRPDSQTDKGLVRVSNSKTSFKSTKAGSTSKSNIKSSPHRISLLDSILQGELPCDLEKNNPTYNILALLRVLEGLNQLAPRLRVQAATDSFSEGKILSLDELSATVVRVSPEEFINSKLTPKLARQIQDALALCSGSLPSWCYQLTKACSFLFPFETRRQYFYSTAFGLSRALYRLQQQQGADGHSSINEREVRVGRLQRQKVRVSRNRILDSAAKVMEMYSSQKAVLEVEYFGEVGTGLGPTLEFYTLLSHDLQKVGLGMWRTGSSPEKPLMEVDGDEQKNRKTDNTTGPGAAAGERDLVNACLGLFPRPWPPHADVSDGSQFCKVNAYFRMIGRVMAKAIQDGRLLDLPLSTAFYKLVLAQELDLHDILSFDAEFGKTLQELQALVCRKECLESMGVHNCDEIADLRFRGVPIEDLCLNFTLPGYPDYTLKPVDENVDINNLGEYISLIVDATVKTGIWRQMEAFRAGFNEVFDISTLQIFSPHELDYLLCGRRELWKAETLVDHIKFDHGYTAKSPAILNLLEIMGEFTPEQQRAFCQFVTGAPRLPPGGLAVLNPKLTIVRKHSSTTSNMTSNGIGSSESADDDLPSVMTCANYLKLPPYSTKEIMYKKLLYAISEGQGSFDLS